MPTRNPIFGYFREEGMDLNTLSVSQTIPAAGFREVTVIAVKASGDFMVAELKIQISGDGTNWFDVPDKKMKGPGVMHDVPIGTEFFRVVVEKVEGMPGTVDITFNAKR